MSIPSGISKAHQESPRLFAHETFDHLLPKESQSVSIKEQHPAILEMNRTGVLIYVDQLEQLQIRRFHKNVHLSDFRDTGAYQGIRVHEKRGGGWDSRGNVISL